MTTSLVSRLREAPTTVPALGAVALLVVWATSQAGYPVTHWAPGSVIVLALLVTTFLAVPLRLAQIPRTVKIAIACLAGFTALSFLSILWAAEAGVAWEGANRTLLYLLVFCLFATWPRRGASAAILLGAWTLAMVVLAVFVMLHLDGVSQNGLGALLPKGRLVYPAGYANADAAEWLMAFWPAVLLARSERVPWVLRGALAGGAVVLAGLALLSVSRGSLYSTPVMLVGVFLLLPGRLRTFALLIPVGVGIGAVAPAVLRVGDHLHNGVVAKSTLHSAIVAVLIAAVVVGLVVALAGAVETHGARALSSHSRARVRTGVGGLAVATLIAVIVGGLVVGGNPVTRIEHGWDTFKGGYAANATTGNRLTSGLGSNRYDFYRVALDEFRAHPLLGIGADNFAESYLRHGRSDETPHYPHSVELRTISQTGLIGGLLAVIGLAAALLAVARAIRGPDRLGRIVAAAAIAGFAYWVVHGSFDWFWEFAGLGAPAFALLGIACSLTPSAARASVRHAFATAIAPISDPVPAVDRPSLDRPVAGLARSQASAQPQVSPAPEAPAGDSPAPTNRRRPRRLALGLVAGLVVLAAVASLVAPWLSELQIERAARIWVASPTKAYSELDSAARLNPLSEQAYLVAGGIALRFDDLAYARRQFSLALHRTPGNAYATLELGAIASSEGRPALARKTLRRAAYLDPRDPLVTQSLALARDGARIDIESLNRVILLGARELE